MEAFDSNWLGTMGPNVDAFERELAELTNAGYAAALSSCTAAMHLALVVLGVERGDEVIVSDLTFAASANAITYVGATPVFIDSELASWNMDPNLLREELAACASRGKLPKAVVVVDLYGQCADYDPIREACTEYGVPIVEDAAESLGATYKGASAGTLTEIGCYSFNGNKIITTSGGGMMVSKNKSWVDLARKLANQAREPVPHYEHTTIGYNYRLSNLLAAVGRGQLRVLGQRVRQRQANMAFYRQHLGGLPGLEFMPDADFGRPTNWLCCLTIDESAFGLSSGALAESLSTLSIEARPVWKPMHLQPVFSGCRVRGGGVSGKLFSSGLCLPSSSSLTYEDRQRVVDGVVNARPR